MATFIPRVENRDRFKGTAEKALLEKLPVSRMQPVQSASSARLKNTMRKQITSIPALVERAVIRLFGDAGEDTKFGTDTKGIS